MDSSTAKCYSCDHDLYPFPQGHLLCGLTSWAISPPPCMYMCACVYICTCMCMYAYVYVCVHVSCTGGWCRAIYPCICMYNACIVYICMHDACIIYVHAWMDVHICTYMWTASHRSACKLYILYMYSWCMHCVSMLCFIYVYVLYTCVYINAYI